MPVSMTPYMQFIHKSRYARWVSALNRRENWQETVGRYVSFFAPRIPESDRAAISAELERAILELETMPSMRALMTAGPALQKDNVAGFNCSFLVVDDVRAFDEAMYISMCFHPDTLVRVKGGVKPISQIELGDWVLSKDETGFFYQPVADVVENSTENRPKVELEFSDGSKVKCSEEHEFLTRRGYVAAKDLTPDDDIEEESVLVYSLTNIKNGRAKSEEIRAMLSRQNSGGGNPSARPVIVGDQIFSCLKQAALELGISRDKIYSLLKKGTAQYASR